NDRDDSRAPVQGRGAGGRPLDRQSRIIDKSAVRDLRSEMSKPLWSGRFDSAPDPAAFDFGVSFPFDRRLFEDDVTGSLAWAEALARAGVLSADDARAITGGLTAILEQGRKDPAWVNGDDEDVHSFV